MADKEAGEGREAFEMDKLTATSMVAISVLVVVQLLQLSDLDFALQVSLYCFALCLPTMGTCVTMLNVEEYQKDIVRPKSMERIPMVGLFSGFIGIASIFWHFSWKVSLLFIVVTLYARISFLDYWKGLHKTKEKVTANQSLKPPL